MSSTGTKIRQGLRQLGQPSIEVASAVYAAGSLDTDLNTIKVYKSDDNALVEGVRLGASIGPAVGFTIFPSDNSNVIIASIDGPGEWTLLKADNIEKATICVDDVTIVTDNTGVKIQKDSVSFYVGPDLFKMTTASESLFQLLKDCFTYISELTVPTPSGTSGVPTNIADFTNLISRLNNLLTP